MIVSKTIIFIDIRGFTKACENPHLNLCLNDFLHEYYTVVEEHFENSLVKYIGDGAMVITSDNIDVVIDKLRTIRREFERIWRHYKSEGAIDAHDLLLGVGITKGYLIKIDIKTRKGTTVEDYIGSRINLAARLCGFARPHGIVIHKESFHDLPERFVTDFKISVLKNLPGFEAQDDIRCWAEHQVDITQGAMRVQQINVEVHVTGLPFKDGKLLLCQRSPTREIAPLKWAGPGGKLLNNQSFEQSLTNIFRNEIGAEIGNLHAIDTYYIKGQDIPGLVYYCDIVGGDPTNHDGQSHAIRYFDREELMDMQDSLLPSPRSIERAFEINAIHHRLPLRFRVVTTTECNLRCEFCHSEHVESDGKCNLERIKTTLNRLSEHFDVYHITLTGGEPFQDSNLHRTFAIVKHLREELGYRGDLSLITNGLPITDAILEETARYDVQLKISVFSLGADDVSVVPDPGYFDTMMDMMIKIQQSGVRYSLNVLLRKSVENRIVEFIDHLTRLKVNPLNIKFIEMVRPNPDNAFYDREHINVEDLSFYRKNRDFIYFNNEAFTNKMSLHYKRYNLVFLKYPCHSVDNCKSCLENWDLIVTPTGELQICPNILTNNRHILHLNKLSSTPIVFRNYRELYFE